VTRERLLSGGERKKKEVWRRCFATNPRKKEKKGEKREEGESGDASVAQDEQSAGNVFFILLKEERERGRAIGILWPA